MHDDTIQYSFNCANPNKVVDRLIDMKRLRNDAELSRVLGVAPATICKIRAGKSAVSAAIVLRIHETFDVPVAEVRALLASR